MYKKETWVKKSFRIPTEFMNLLEYIAEHTESNTSEVLRHLLQVHLDDYALTIFKHFDRTVSGHQNAGVSKNRSQRELVFDATQGDIFCQKNSVEDVRSTPPVGHVVSNGFDLSNGKTLPSPPPRHPF